MICSCSLSMYMYQIKEKLYIKSQITVQNYFYETCISWPWWEKIWHKNSIPRVDMLLCYVQVCNHEKTKCIRSQFSEILFINFHQLAIIAKAFIRHQNSVPKGLSARAPGLCTCKKSQFNQICFRNLHQLATVTTGFIRHQNSVPKRWSAPVLRLPTCIKKICIKSHFKEISFKLASVGHSDKNSFDIKIMFPRGYLPLLWGYVHV